MSLLKLTPETVRLRRIAKAYAAGECSYEAYRAARREIIDNFSCFAADDDDTRRRWPEQTLSGVDPESRAVTSERASAATGDAANGASRRLSWLVLVLLLLAIALLLRPLSARAGDSPVAGSPMAALAGEDACYAQNGKFPLITGR
ncbi:MAG: hypothetical protein R3E86_13670 [Pseudomonadales bacterium]